MVTIEERALPEFPPHQMTIERYQRMVEAGVYGKDDRTFLWNGKLVEHLPKSLSSEFASMSLLERLIKIVPDGWHVGYRLSLAVGLDSMPEPDLLVVRGEPEDFLHRSRKSPDVAILIEISDSGLSQDLNVLVKQPAYAADAVPVYWIVDLPNRSVMIFSGPSGPTEKPSYKWDGWHGPDDVIAINLDGREVGRISVKEILP
jgi:Uma2 family endonuclease